MSILIGFVNGGLVAFIGLLIVSIYLSWRAWIYAVTNKNMRGTLR